MLEEKEPVFMKMRKKMTKCKGGNGERGEREKTR